LLKKRQMPYLCWISRFSRALLLSFLLLGGDLRCSWSGTITTVLDIVGDYRRIGPATVAPSVSVQAGGVEVRLEGGGPPGSDGSVPANCVVQAVGQLNDQLLTATFQPVETKDFSYGAVQASAENRKLVVAFASGTVEVKDAEIYGYCGIGVDFRGLYQKRE
jgi:hypothetical protein